ncbi:MAG TPA: LamG-like jellyroll fold domain-containing protein, partial [Phycisphaerae bacterium]|nr:LamG-like jellyroll fold domain-containing protein [Phycisphaerae bacterium]
RNVFCKTTSQFAVFEHDGRKHEDVESFAKAVLERKCLAGDNNVGIAKMPVRNAEKHDFHPSPGSAAIDRGAKVFVPWALSRMVGEWNFRRNNVDPTALQDDHWYMAPYYVARDKYAQMPAFDLKGANVKAEDYVPGPLEDWCHGALKFNGKDQYAFAAAGDLGREVSYTVTVKRRKERRTARLASPDIEQTSFLIEVYFQTVPGHAGGVLVAKMDNRAGWQLAINKAGGATLSLKAGSTTAQLPCGAKVNDGKWHHLIAEVDRPAGKGAIYVDGRKAAEGPVDLGDASLSNGGDLLVGKAGDGHYFAGALEFLRIARGTLTEAKTTIEELYDWQFDGPFLRDFAGRSPAGKARDAGAFEAKGN